MDETPVTIETMAKKDSETPASTAESDPHELGVNVLDANVHTSLTGGTR